MNRKPEGKSRSKVVIIWHFKIVGNLKFGAFCNLCFFKFAAFFILPNKMVAKLMFKYSQQNSWGSDICGVFMFMAKFAAKQHKKTMNNKEKIRTLGLGQNIRKK